MAGSARPRYHPDGSCRPGAGANRPVQVSRSNCDRVEIHATLLAAAIAAIALYLPAIGFELVFDDHSLIGPGGPRWLGPTWMPYRPLRYLSLSLDYVLGGGSAAAYHATNVLLHAAVAVCVALLAGRLGARRELAAAAGVLMSIHPLAVEAVAYVAGRRDVLALLLTLAALLVWTGDRPRVKTALLLGLAAVAAKESGALAVLLLAVASRAGLGPSPSPRLWAALAAAGAATIGLAAAYGARGPLVPAGTLAGTVSMALHLSAHYGRHLLWPLDLSVEYPALSDAARVWPSPGVAAAGAVLALAAAGSLAWALSRPGRGTAALAVAWPAAVLLSVSLVIGAHEPGADRHGYPLVAAVAVLLAVAATRGLETGVAGRLSPWAPVCRAATACVVVILATGAVMVSHQRIEVWRNDVTLWRATLATTPGSRRARVNLAAALAARGRTVAARRVLCRGPASGDPQPIACRSRRANDVFPPARSALADVVSSGESRL